MKRKCANFAPEIDCCTPDSFRRFCTSKKSISKLQTSFQMFRKDRISPQIHAFCQASNLIIFIFCLCFMNVHAQFQDSFPRFGPLHQAWFGDRSHFLVNAAGQLQLSAPNAGTSSLFRKITLPADSLDLRWYFRMNFAPSGDNQIKLFLWTTSLDETKASGLYLIAGENGSQDAIQLWQMDEGQHRKLGTGTAGTISQDPAQARLSVSLFSGIPGILYADYSGGHWLSEELLFHPSISIPADSVYVGLKCTYTQSRKSLFYVDDLSYQKYVPDQTPLRIDKVRVENSRQIRLYFSEQPSETHVRKTENYRLNQNAGHPDSVIYPLPEPGQALLNWSNPFQSVAPYTLRMENLPDANGNAAIQEVSFVYAASPQAGELVISEILFYPETGGTDFVELCNISQKYVSLRNLQLINSQLSQSTVIQPEIVLVPGSYLALAKDTSYLRSHYSTPDTARFLQMTLPQWHSDEGNVTIRLTTSQAGVTLDSIDYSASWHSPALQRTQGVSLERIHFQGDSNQPSSWHSAASKYRYATPGYANSTRLQDSVRLLQNGSFHLSSEVITPDNDGVDDFCHFTILQKKPGFLATVQVADVEGFPVCTVLNNALLGIENSFSWEAVDAAGRKVPRGIYILVCRAFHPDGDTYHAIKAVSVFNAK